jgi:hypothetical protein
MSQHALGPWKLWQEGTDIMVIGDGSHIATVPIGSRVDEPSDRANARLIAAAPELLDALRELTIAAEAAGWDVDAANAPILNAARAAIAKATGEAA